MDVQIEITEIIASAEISETVINCEVIFGGGSSVTKTSDLQNDGADGVNPFITAEYIDPNTVIDADYVHTDNNYDDAAVLEVAKIADKQNVTDNTLETTAQTIAAAINEVRTIALGADIAYVFDTEALMEAWILIPANVALLEVGNLFLIRELTVPDYWWDGVSALELEVKIDLTNYYTKSEIDTLLNGKQDTIIPTVDTTPVDTDEVITKRGGVWLRTTFANWIVKLLTYFYSKTQTDQKYVAQNGGTIYHNTKWFTPTAGQTLTINASGTQATMSGGSLFTAAMTGAKIRVVGSEIEPIIAYQSSTVINLSPALGSALFGQVVAFGNWGVYSIAIVVTADTFNFKSSTGSNLLRSQFAVIYAPSIIEAANLSLTNGGSCDFDYRAWFRFSTNQFFETKVVGIAKSTGACIEINDGVTRGQYRDLALRWIYQSIGTVTGDAIGDKRTGNVGGIQVTQTCTVANAVKGASTGWVEKQLIGGEKALTNNVQTNILDVNCAVNTMQCCIIEYSISAIDTVNNLVRSHIGYMNLNIRNQNGVITTNIEHPAALENDLGTLTDSWVLTNGANKATLSLQCNAAGMTPTGMTLYFDVKNQGKNSIVVL